MSNDEQRFTASVANHKQVATGGTLRHLRFHAATGAAWYCWFEIVTWRGCLTIRGDMGTFVFAVSSTDPFDLFRQGRDINPGYWAEKLQAVDTDSGCRAFSERQFLRQVWGAFEEYVDHMGEDDLDVLLNLWRSIEQEVLESGSESEESAFAAMADFSGPSSIFWDSWEWDLTDWTAQYLWCCRAIRWAIEYAEA